MNNNYERNYHVDVFWESKFTDKINKTLNSNYELEFSKHSYKQQSNEIPRRNYNVKNLTVEHLKKGNIIEITFDQINSMTKYLIRVPNMVNDEDWCLIVMPKPIEKKLFVKTIWINESSDSHDTLDVEKYCREKLSTTDCKACTRKDCTLKINNLSHS